jgi:hypothetical protein
MHLLRFAFSWAAMTACGLAAAGCGGGSSSGGNGCNPFTGVCVGTGGSTVGGSGGYGYGGSGGTSLGGSGGVFFGGSGGIGGLATGGIGGTTTCPPGGSTLLNCTATAAFAGIGSTVTGTLGSGDATGSPRGTGYYADVITFQGTAGTAVAITVTAATSTTGGTLDTYMYLMDNTCTELTYNDDGAGALLSMISYTLPYTGQYTVMLTTYSSCSGGTYTVTLT